MRDPQQELFSELKIRLEEKGYAVYDGFLPPEGTAYPFVYLGDSQQTDDECKGAILGNVYQTIHVWHSTPKRRGDLSQMLLAIKQICRLVAHTATFTWSVRNISQRIVPDTTTSVPLLHGVIDVEWKFS